jgi:hypothetical protein
MATDADWLQWFKELAAQDATVELAKAVRLDAFGVVGRIFTLWERYDDEEGEPLPANEVDALTRRAGFADALIATGWAVPRIGGLEFPVFDEYQAKVDKGRRQNRNRVYKHRKQQKLEDQAKAIYKAYPKHVGGARARQKIRIALGKVEFKFLLRKTGEYAESVEHLKGTKQWEIVPLPVTWYGQERWDDRPEDRPTARTEASRPGRV